MAGEGDRRAGPEVAPGREPRLENPRRLSRRRGPPRRRDRDRQHDRLLRRCWPSRSRTRRAGPRCGGRSSTGTSSGLAARDRARLPAQREDLPASRRRSSSSSRSLLAVIRSLPGPGLLPAPRARRSLRRLLPRRADDPRDRDPRLRRAGAAAAARTDLDDVLGDRRARARLHRVRVRGVSRRHRVGAPEPGAAARSLGLTHAPGAALRGAPAGGAPGDPAAAQRLHRAAEGHRARRLPRRPSRRSSSRRSTRRRRSTTRRTSRPRCSSSRSRSRSRGSPTGWCCATGAGRRRRARERSAALEGAAQVLRQARGAPRHRPARRRARRRLPDRRVRLGQVDAAPLRQPARADRRGTHRRRGRGDHRHTASTSTRPPADRDRLPGVQPLPAHERPRQRHTRADGRRSRLPARRPRPRRRRAARALRPRRQAQRVSGPALGRAAAARRDRARARDAART